MHASHMLIILVLALASFPSNNSLHLQVDVISLHRGGNVVGGTMGQMHSPPLPPPIPHSHAFIVTATITVTITIPLATEGHAVVACARVSRFLPLFDSVVVFLRQQVFRDIESRPVDCVHLFLRLLHTQTCACVRAGEQRTGKRTIERQNNRTRTRTKRKRT